MLVAVQAQGINQELLAELLSDDLFWPDEPNTLPDAGLTEPFIESLVCKTLAVRGTSSGRAISEAIALPFALMGEVLATLRSRELLAHAGSAPLDDCYYALSDEGRQFALTCTKQCAYVGPAPVPLADYVVSVEAQAVRAQSLRHEQLANALSGISVAPELLEFLGPAISAGTGIFLYGAPGNGKSTLAKRITMCFGQEIWLPHALIDDGNVIKLYDISYHHAVDPGHDQLIQRSDFDRRWIKIRRPTVAVGGELTMESLEIRHDPTSHVSEAPIHLKSNCGCLLVDDLGRQRIAPAELLNRWIAPLENRQDFLTLSTGKKVHVPFEQLIIFATNLDLHSLVDEAFLRRVPYKIEISDPDHDEFHRLFDLYAAGHGLEYREEVIDQLIEKHYTEACRPMRRCHPRDLLNQVRSFCLYNGLEPEMSGDYFDHVAKTYFSTGLGSSAPSPA